MTVSNDFWSPSNIAQRTAQAQQRIAAEQAAQQEAQRQHFLSTVGQKVVDIINGYVLENRPPDTLQVEMDFMREVPDAPPGAFRQIVETLKQEGVIYEMQGAEGFMGMRSTRLYVL